MYDPLFQVIQENKSITHSLLYLPLSRNKMALVKLCLWYFLPSIRIRSSKQSWHQVHNSHHHQSHSHRCCSHRHTSHLQYSEERDLNKLEYKITHMSTAPKNSYKSAVAWSLAYFTSKKNDYIPGEWKKTNSISQDFLPPNQHCQFVLYYLDSDQNTNIQQLLMN